MKMKLMLMVLALVVFAGSAQAGYYRLAFITSTNPGTGGRTTIEEFNAYVQGLADVAGIGYSYNPSNLLGPDGLKWNVIGSTSLVDARDNTGTNPNTDGTGVPIYLVTPTTSVDDAVGAMVADNNAKLWSGNIDHIINADENGNAKTHWPFTGTKLDGTKSDYVNTHGGPLDDASIAQGNGGSTTEWIWRQWTARPWPDSGNGKSYLPVYAMSEIIPEPATIGLLGMGALALIRRKRN